MALAVSYFSGNGDTRYTDKVYGGLTGSALVTLTGTSASLGTVPANTVLARLRAGETCVVSNNGTAAADTNGVRMEAGDVVDMIISTGSTLLGKTTT